jgi:ATP/maltotriose-dependent transcriptional regulator MalT
MVSESDPLALGRAALGQAAWSQACLHFDEAAAAGDAAEAWEGLSWAAWWQGDQDRTLSARERAYRVYRGTGDVCGAARMAMWLASDHLKFRGDDELALAWVACGRALVSGHEPCTETGFIRVLEADMALLAKCDPASAERLAREALDLARGIADVGVEVVALAVLGSALVASGSAEEGLSRLDEAAALAVGEEFAETIAPGWALCHTVSAYAEVGDFGRAAQWCRALHSWSATWHARHFFGVCRTAYGQVLAAGGDWPTAEQELQSAMADLCASRPGLVAPTAVRLGRLRSRQGNHAEARRLFEAALPLPAAITALGELDLAGGDPTAAADAADRALRRLGDASVLDRLPALELLARARAAGGDRAGAAAAAEQVECQATRFATPYMRGRGRLVRAEVLLAGGDHDAARRSAEDAVDLFGACSAPYEAAQARMLLSEALRALGRLERAEAEARSAREAFALLGTRRPSRPNRSEELSLREADILRLVAGGLSDAQIAGRLFLSVHTVHRHVANIRTKFGVSSRAAAVGHAAHHGML